ncbi:MAG TPA: T9SS type A sorting domain-containing protein [Bacteroidia bacterium]|nr:T9SS type A sorting domain-containing protein [Bacteroidia bacterium]
MLNTKINSKEVVWKKMYFIICLSLIFLSGINSADAALIIITAQTSPTEAFVPSIANAVCGDTIRWVNGNGTHTTASTTIPVGAASWNSPNLTTAGYTYVVTVAGTYNYVCHPLTGGHMNASIVVTCSVGIPSVAPGTISFAYPNPFSGSITIEEAANADMLILYDMLGNKVKSVSLQQGQTKVEVDAAALTKGIYFYSIIKQGAVLETRKVVIQ